MLTRIAGNLRSHAMTKRIYRQGDVMLEKLDKRLITGAPVARKGGRVVLAEGEVTGHAHAIDSTLAQLFEEKDGQLYLRVEPGEPVYLRHEEHAEILLDPGIYRLRHQREYHPSVLRRVAD